VVTCPLVPDVPHLRSGSCTSPCIFGLGFLQTSSRDDALVLLLTLGSANTWCEDFHLTSYVPCLAHTVAVSSRGERRRASGLLDCGVGLATDSAGQNHSGAPVVGFTALWPFAATSLDKPPRREADWVHHRNGRVRGYRDGIGHRVSARSGARDPVVLNAGRNRPHRADQEAHHK